MRIERDLKHLAAGNVQADLLTKAKWLQQPTHVRSAVQMNQCITQ